MSRLQSDVLPRAVARLSVTFGTGERPQVGTAFLVSPLQALTCAHCVRDLRNLQVLPEGLAISLEFTQLRSVPYRARVVWSVFAPERGIDIALLALDEPVQSATILCLAPESDVSQGGQWRSFGYPQAVATAQWVEGTTSGLLTEGNRSVLALRSAQAREVLSGLSGAPVLTGDRVIGVLSQQLLQTNILGQVVPAFDVAYAVAIGRVLKDPEVEGAIRTAGVSLDVATSDPAARRSLAVLDAAGNPFRVEQIVDLALFGVRRARNDIDTHGDEYFPYVARDIDVAIRDTLNELAVGKTRKMLLLVGESTAGKSRTGCEAIRRSRNLKDRVLLVPHPNELANIPEALLDGKALLWLDDVERYLVCGLDRTRLRDLLDKTVVVATLRSEQLQQFMPFRGSRSPVWELLNDSSIVIQLPLSREWTSEEQERLRQAVSSEVVIQGAAETGGLGEYLSAGPELALRYKGANATQLAIVRLAADWARVRFDEPLPEPVARELWPEYLSSREGKRVQGMPDEVREKAYVAGRDWAAETIVGNSALVARTREGLLSHDYLPGLRTADSEPTIPGAVWKAALEAARVSSREWMGPYMMGGLATIAGQYDIAREAWTGVAERGHTDAMLGLAMLERTLGDLETAHQWNERAAAAGDVGGMYGLGFDAHEKGDDDAARSIWEKAAAGGSAMAMRGLAAISLESGDMKSARRWFEDAAERGDAEAMRYLGLLEGTAPDEAARWLSRAAEKGDAEAMFSLGRLSHESDPTAARTWYERAAAESHTNAMVNLGALLQESDPTGARAWYERAATAGNTNAMENLSALLHESDPIAARAWSERAAAAGQPKAMTMLGCLLWSQDPEGARVWWEKAAIAGETVALEKLRECCLDWYRKAAREGSLDAMMMLGGLLVGNDDAEAREWWEKAAAAGVPFAMLNLANLLKETDPTAANEWRERAERAGVREEDIRPR